MDTGIQKLVNTKSKYKLTTNLVLPVKIWRSEIWSSLLGMWLKFLQHIK